jgi:hypothetical protein
MFNLSLFNEGGGNTVPTYSGDADVVLPHIFLGDITGTAYKIYSGSASITLPGLRQNITGGSIKPQFNGNVTVTLPLIKNSLIGTSLVPVFSGQCGINMFAIIDVSSYARNVTFGPKIYRRSRIVNKISNKSKVRII